LQFTTEIPDFGARYGRSAALGDGGMASVFRVFDHSAGKWRAAKVLPTAAKPAMRKRFEDEARAMMEIRHRNVVRVHDVYVDGAVPFFVMDLAEGGSLTDWLNANGAMPPRMACDAAMQICKGVNAAHVLGIVHRDIKPHNVLINRRGLCKITDFGIASFSENNGLTDTGSSFGTLGYMAPEQRANAKGVDERADVYSICATLFTLLTARQQMELFFAEQEPEMLDGVPEDLKALIMRGTRYRPDERFQTVKEIAKAIFKARKDFPPDPLDTPPLASKEIEHESVDDDDTARGEDVGDPSTANFVGEIPFSTPPAAPVATPPVATPPVATSPVATPVTKPPTPNIDGPTLEPPSAIPPAKVTKRKKRARPSIVQMLVPAAALVAVVMVLGVTIVAQGTLSLRSAQSATVEAEAEWQGALSRNQTILDELEILGAKRSELDQLYRRSDEPEKLVAGLRGFAKARQPSQLDANAPRVKKIKDGIDNLEIASISRDESRTSWVDASGSATGRLSVALGLASPAPW